MDDLILCKIKEYGIKYYFDGVYNLRYDYIDKNNILCSIFITTNNVTDSIIKKIIKNG